MIAANLAQRGQTLLYSNKINEGVDDCVDAFELASKIHQPRAQMVAAAVGAYVGDVKGDREQGILWAQKCIEIAQRLGAPLFEACGLEYLGRFAFQNDKVEKARQLIHEGLRLLRDSSAGMRFNGARHLGALAIVSEDTDERIAALDEGKQLLRKGALGHNHLWFYRDAMEASLEMQQWDEVERYAAALERCTHDEPLPWGEFYISRARLLAKYRRGRYKESVVEKIRNLREQAEKLGFRQALPAIDTVLSEEM